jgi:hypothetical protein
MFTAGLVVWAAAGMVASAIRVDGEGVPHPDASSEHGGDSTHWAYHGRHVEHGQRLQENLAVNLAKVARTPAKMHTRGNCSGVICGGHGVCAPFVPAGVARPYTCKCGVGYGGRGAQKARA